MKTATIKLSSMPKECYWPKGWNRPDDGLPQFRGTEPTPGIAGMEVLQDGEWVALPSKAALHIRVKTCEVGDLRDMLELLRDHDGECLGDHPDWLAKIDALLGR